MNPIFTFECGCSLPILEEFDDRPPALDLDFENIPDTCPATAALLAQGKTIGIFQLEKNLGKKWTKRLRPETVEHLSALVALLRPGCLNAVDEKGISSTEHYCLRKNSEEDSAEIHPIIDNLLADTYNLIIYQEQFMRIAADICGFTPLEVDKLRKASGKKLASEMAAVGKMFIEKGTSLQIVPEDVVKAIWDIVDKASRYSFNRAHSASYGLRAWQTAWLKVHFPHLFYNCWLETAHLKAEAKDEMRILIDDARSNEIEVRGPNILNIRPHFFREGTGIRFGLADIRGVGEKTLEKLEEVLQKAEKDLGKPLSDFSPLELLFHPLVELNKTVVTALISSGAFSHWRMPRKTLLHYHDALARLTEKEMAYCREVIKSPLLKDIVPDNIQGALSRILRQCAAPKKAGGGVATKNRIDMVLGVASLIDNPPSSLRDTAAWVAQNEENFLGVALSCTRADDCEGSFEVDSCCKDFQDGSSNSMNFGILAVEVKNVKEVLTKKGENPGQRMAFVNIADSSGAMDAVCFPTEYKRFGAYLRPNNVIIVKLEKGKQGPVIKVVWQA